MGRLSKKKVDRIIEMLEQNYTVREIAEDVDCSESTINRYKKQLMKTPSRPIETDHYLMFELLFNAVLSMITHIEFLFDLIKIDDFKVQFWRYHALFILQKLAEMNPDFFRTVYDKSEFSVVMENGFSIDKTNLNEWEKQKRMNWINLLKDYYPAKLGDLID